MINAELLESALRAFDEAPSTCTVQDGKSCAWYHGSWQFFRVLDLVSTPAKHEEHFAGALAEIDPLSDMHHVLVSGAADYAMVEMLHRCRDERKIEVTIVDRCRTPLNICEAFAERHGQDWHTRCQDILDPLPDKTFSVVLTHSFLGYFNKDHRSRVVRQWYRSLRPGGRLVTVQRIREDYADERLQFTDAEVDDFVARVTDCLPAIAGEIGTINLPQLARAYATEVTNWPLNSAAELRQMFESSGFRLRRFERRRTGDAGGITGPGIPNSDGYYMIDAERP